MSADPDSAAAPSAQRAAVAVWPHSRWTVAALVVATLGLQGWVLAVRPPSSFLKYPAAAARLLSGDLAAERLADFSPAYLSLHVAMQRLLGASAASPAASVLQVTLLAVGSALLWRWLLARLGSGAPRAVAVATVAAMMLWLLNPGVLVYGSVLEPEALLLFLMSALLFVTHRTAAVPGVLGALLAGLLCAACIATRPTLIAAALLVPLGWWLEPAGQESFVRRRLWRAVIPFLIPVALALLALSGRNAAAGGSFSPSVMNPGTVFFEGNHPLSWGSSGIYPPAHHELESGEEGGRPDAAHDHYRRLARAALGDELSTGGVNGYWAGKARAFIVDHPLRWLRTEAAKLGALVRGFEEHDTATAEQTHRALVEAGVPRLSFPLLGLLALWGMVAGARRWRELLLPYGLVLSQVVSMLLFYVSARQRLTLLPPLLLFAAIGAADLAGRRRRGLLAGLLIAVAAAALLPPSERRADRRHHLEALQAAARLARGAQTMREAGELEAASRLARQSLALAPTFWRRARPADLDFPGGYLAGALAAADAGAAPSDDSAAFDRAMLATLAGEHARGLAAMEELAARPRFYRGAVASSGAGGERAGGLAAMEELAARPRFYRGAVASSEPGVWLARLQRAQGASPEAQVAQLQEVLRRLPGEPFALAELVALSDDAQARERLERYYDPTSASLLIGRALLSQGRWRAAVGELGAVATAVPEMRGVWLDLAAALSQSDERTDLERGRDAYLRAMVLGAEPLAHEPEILQLFRKLGEQLAGDGGAMRLEARVLRQYGHYREAYEVLTRVPQDGAEGAEIAAELAWLEDALGR